MDDYTVARAQYIKTKRTETRLKFGLMADAEIADLLPKWKAEFDREAEATHPEPISLISELRKLHA